MSDNTGVAVYCEVDKGVLTAVTAEGLGIGRILADELGQKLSAVLVGSGIGDFAAPAVSLGADAVYVIDNPRLATYETDAYIHAVSVVLGQIKPAVFIMGQTDTGRDLAPRLAFRLNTAATLDCVGLATDKDTGRLLATKPVYGGNALAVFTGEDEPRIVTIRSKAFSAPEADSARQGEIVTVPADLGDVDVRTKTTGHVIEEGDGIKLEDAAIVVAGGRGIGSPEGFRQLRELAKLLNGAIGASRPPCDNGWAPDTVQVGLTGKIIAPELYIAVAISGSSQHLSGCSGARNIVAINKDKEANIFRLARYGAVGDWKKILPAFIEKIRELTAS